MQAADMTLTQARAALAAKTMSAAEYAQALINVQQAQTAVNAWVSQDSDALLAAARACDSGGWCQQADKALAGIPIALKDNIDTLSLSTSGGTPALKDAQPLHNAPVAQSLFDAGALLAGKTNMHELAFGISTNNAYTGATRNPWNHDMIAGGSSGGSAAAVAARMVPASLGTDTGASVRVPAALCGVVGFRPTVGRYSGTGIIPISHTRDTAGPITRSVEDAALMDSVLCGAAVGLDKLDLKGLRLGVPRVDFYQGADDEVLKAMEALLAQLARAGVTLVEGDVAGMSALNAQVGFPVALYELTVDLPAYLAHNRYKLTLAQIAEKIASPDVAGIVGSQLGDQAMPRAAYDAALKARVHLQAVYAEHFSSHRLDALVFPTTVLPARPIGQDETVELNGAQVPTFPTYIRNTDPGSNAGIPGISIPMGLNKAGLPLGLELDGPVASDRRLLAVAAAIEALLPPMPAPKR